MLAIRGIESVWFFQPLHNSLSLYSLNYVTATTSKSKGLSLEEIKPWNIIFAPGKANFSNEKPAI